MYSMLAPTYQDKALTDPKDTKDRLSTAMSSVIHILNFPTPKTGALIHLRALLRTPRFAWVTILQPGVPCMLVLSHEKTNGNVLMLTKLLCWGAPWVEQYSGKIQLICIHWI